jgi:hypothetical protein
MPDQGNVGQIEGHGAINEYWRAECEIDILAEMNSFNIEGRYPDTSMPLPSSEEAHAYMNRATEIYQWLMSRLH